MATTSPLDRVTAVVLRRMRGPIFLLIVVYAVGIFGMSMLPGPLVEGEPSRMSLFHSFYFFTYTATTTGFGEIPRHFNDIQRLWAVLCLYVGVIAWLFAIGSIIALVQNPHFVQALAERRFARAARRIHEPFFIVCGFGDTGSLLARGFSDNLVTAVVIDNDSERIKALALRDYRVPMPGLLGDASVPQHLIDAGIRAPNCHGVVALTNDDNINLKIVVMTRALNPRLAIVCRTTSKRHQTLLQSMDHVSVINPFELFAEQLSTTITTPRLRVLEDWFVCVRDSNLHQSAKVPVGPWFLFGYGRMGQAIHAKLASDQLPVVAIDPDPDNLAMEHPVIRSYPEPEVLEREGFRDAVGFVCGTDQDAENLAILLATRRLNATAFAIVRQNHHENHLAFEGADADMTMQPSLVTARKVLLTLIAPLAVKLIEEMSRRDEAFTQKVIDTLANSVAPGKPLLWCQTIASAETSAVIEPIDNHTPVRLGDCLRDPRNRRNRLPCVALTLTRNEQTTMMPDDSVDLQPGDQILFCGTQVGQRLLDSNLNNAYTLYYLITGEETPRGVIFSWWKSKSKNVAAAH